MSSGDMKISRIKTRHQTEFALLGDVVSRAQQEIPKLRRTAETTREARDMEDTLSTLGAYVRKNGFDPTRMIQHVARYDTEVWTLVLDMFAKHDPETGEPMDDGLLYKYDPDAGAVKLNKDFFFALLDYFETQGIACDMRGKIKLN